MHTTDFNLDLSASSRNLPHFWEHTVGSGHAPLALRADWQSQLVRCHKELGFKHVRFHGILSDDVGPLNKQKDDLIYSFFNINQICDFLLSADMKPFMELSFMPTALASGTTTVFHYKANVTPPRDNRQWEAFIKKLARNFTDRYGLEEVSQWFFEVWNEPNLDAFWTGSKQDYFKFFEATQSALKSVHPSLRVGGPATAKNEWIADFLEFCDKNKCAADFVSTHHYPTDAFGNASDDTVSQLSQSHASALFEQASKVKEQCHGLPLYYTEWNSSSNPFDPLHDQSYCAAFIVKTVLEARALVSGYSFWTFSDLFEENYFSSQPFHGGFGLLNIYGIPKPAYRAFQLLHHLGEEIFEIKGTHKTVNVWATRAGSVLKFLFINWALPRHAIKKEKVTLKIQEVDPLRGAYVERIDDGHANPAKIWREMEKPCTLSRTDVEVLDLASQLSKDPVAIQYDQNSAVVELEIPPQGIACVTLEAG